MNRRERGLSIDARADLPARRVPAAVSGLALLLLLAETTPSSALDRSRFGAPATTSADMILREGLGATAHPHGGHAQRRSECRGSSLSPIL